jgi:hypothetical protein
VTARKAFRCALCVVLLVAAVLVFLRLARHRQVDYGDVPTWMAFAAAAVAGLIALGQLRSQQREIERQARVLERQQATSVTLGWSPGTGSDIGDPVPGPDAYLSIVFVSNGSGSPIRNVACQILPAGADRMNPWAAGNYWPEQARVRLRPIMEPVTGLDVASLVLGGRSAGFLFEYVIQKDTGLIARFTDYEGRYWEINDLMQLKPLNHRDDW